MKRTNADDFRSNLKEWMEAARKDPIKITRKTGEAFVLMSAEEFEKNQIELASLRGVALGLSDIISGKVKESQPKSTDSAIEKAKTRVLGKKSKKAVG